MPLLFLLVYFVKVQIFAWGFKIPLPNLPAHILLLLEIAPTQVLAYELAVHDGIEPGQVQYIQRVITSEHGIMHPLPPVPR